VTTVAGTRLSLLLPQVRVHGASVEGRSGGDKFLVYVRGSDPRTASEIWQRTQMLRSVAVN
jgi:hypothetical protein